MSQPGPEPIAAVHNDSAGLAVAPVRAPRQWMAPLAVLLSLVATALSVWVLVKPVKPAPEPPTMFAGNPSAVDPKAEACRVALLVAEGVALQSRADLGQDPVALDTVAANTRLAMAGGAAYLRDFTPSNTPADLATPIGTLARQLQDIAQHFFVGQTGTVPEQTDRMSAATDTTNQLIGLCK